MNAPKVVSSTAVARPRKRDPRSALKPMWREYRIRSLLPCRPLAVGSGSV
jgi:hypothetical protein